MSVLLFRRSSFSTPNATSSRSIWTRTFPVETNEAHRHPGEPPEAPFAQALSAADSSSSKRQASGLPRSPLLWIAALRDVMHAGSFWAAFFIQGSGVFPGSDVFSAVKSMRFTTLEFHLFVWK